MTRAPLRSSLFNILFYLITAIACVLCLPTLALPRRYFMGVVHCFVRSVYFLERCLLGLDYEVRGQENLPQAGSFIIAAKHQSAYETLKLHMLFKDPAVILKKELLSIPLWGLYLKKSDPIAIDRSTPDTAIQSIQNGARRMKEQGRPIIIFPQGTRVNVDQTTKQKPFKVGIARIQEATDLPIVPMALNTGLFWPRSGWLKSPGCVIFEFLKPIKPGLERQKLMAKIEKKTEESSTSLMNEAKEQELNTKQPAGKSGLIAVVLLVALLFGAYSFFWFEVAKQVKNEYVLALQDITESETAPAQPHVYGYPGKIKLHVEKEVLQNDQGDVTVHHLRAEGWPIPALPVKITAGPIQINNFRWAEPFTLDSLYTLLSFNNDVLTIREGALKQGEFNAEVSGTADLKQEPVPKFDLTLKLHNHDSLFQALGKNGIIDPRMAMFFGAGLAGLANKDGVVEIPLVQETDTLYAGPIRIMKIPTQEVPRRSAKTNPVDPAASVSDLDSPQVPSP